jgi:methylmalonyl-CoA/ethylmalonyl-CoA epimerase
MVPGGRVDHVAIAVRSIADSIGFYVDTLGARFLFAGDQNDQGFRWAQFAFPEGGKIELVTPLRDDGFLARFLERHGEGVHHVTFKTDDIDAAIAHLRARGVPLINVNTEHDEWKEAFIHPRDANGTLFQIAQSRLSDEENARHHLTPHEDASHRHVRLEELLSDQPLGTDGT